MHDSFYEWDEAEKGRVASLCFGARGQWTRLWDCPLVSRGKDEQLRKSSSAASETDFEPNTASLRQLLRKGSAPGGSRARKRRA